ELIFLTVLIVFWQWIIVRIQMVPPHTPQFPRLSMGVLSFHVNSPSLSQKDGESFVFTTYMKIKAAVLALFCLLSLILYGLVAYALPFPFWIDPILSYIFTQL